MAVIFHFAGVYIVKFSTFVAKMKAFCSILMLFLLSFQMSMKPLLMIEWKINQATITEKYCENKNNPMMHCEGKCFLAKQFQKLEMEEKEERSKYPFPMEKIKMTENIFFVSPNATTYIYGEPSSSTQKKFLSAEKFYNFDFECKIAHPPQV